MNGLAVGADEASLTVASGDPLIAIDAADLRIVSWNDAAEQFTGFRRQDVTGQLCWLVLGGVDEAGASPVCHAGCAIACSLSEGRQTSCFDLAIRTADGARPTALSTISLHTATRRLIVHTLQPSRSRATSAPARPSVGGAETYRLTPRQLEVLQLLNEGASAREIAASLHVAERTTRNHITAILQELQAHSRLEAVAKARRANLI